MWAAYCFVYNDFQNIKLAHIKTFVMQKDYNNLLFLWCFRTILKKVASKSGYLETLSISLCLNNTMLHDAIVFDKTKCAFLFHTIIMTLSPSIGFL